MESPTLGHGVFTAHLLEGLLGAAAGEDGVITVTQLYDYVSNAFEKIGGQDPVFKGDITGRLILGSDFPPRSERKTNAKLLKRIANEAERHLSDYQLRIGAEYPNLDVWQRTGHRAACMALQPMTVWFEKKELQYPSLPSEGKFADAKDALINRLAHLASVDINLVTDEGIITSRLGGGTFGTVWKVTSHDPNTTPLAYKVYHPQDLTIPKKMERFRRGFQAMEQLDHPHIIKVRRLVTCPLSFYMDLIDGPNLRDFTGTLDEPLDVVSILLTVAETLKHAHGRGVVHRDVKPENILMKLEAETNRWVPFLTDFDLSWFSTATQLTKEPLGNFYYAAPEQLAKPGSASAHAATTDVFSFGQLCFYSVTGTNPVPMNLADNVKLVRNKVSKWGVQKAASQFLELYQECSHLNPKQRLEDFRLVCDRLAQVYQSLKETSDTSDLSVPRLIREVIYSIVGLGPTDLSEERRFLTPSRKTSVELVVIRKMGKSADLRCDFQLAYAPAMPGMDHEKMRRIMNQRIDSAIAKFPSCKRISSTQQPYEAILELSKIDLSWDGVQAVRQILTRVIDVIEGA
jgi:serine/threonine protein kinase